MVEIIITTTIPGVKSRQRARHSRDSLSLNKTRVPRVRERQNGETHA